MGAEQASHSCDPSSHVDEASQHLLVVTTERYVVQFVDFGAVDGDQHPVTEHVSVKGDTVGEGLERSGLERQC